MQNKQNSTAAEIMAAKIEDYAMQTAQKARAICKRNHVPQDAADVFAADAVDILHARFDGLRATTEQMRVITEAVPQRSWDRTENAALCFIGQYYAQIPQALDGDELILGDDFLHAVVVYEVSTRSAPNFVLVCDEEAKKTEARQLYYTYALLSLAENTDATEEELLTIPQPDGADIPRDRVARMVRGGLDFRRQREAIRQRREERAARSGVATHAAAAERYSIPTSRKPTTAKPADGTIVQYQNMAYMIGKGVQTADAGGSESVAKYRPLWQGIAEQRAAWEALIKNPNAADKDKARAADLLATTYAVQQVIDGIQLLPQLKSPDSATTQYSEYVLTPHEYTCILTGQPNPNQEQVYAALRGTAWLSTQRTTIEEHTIKKVTERDSSGVIIRDENGKPKRKDVVRTIVTNFQPVVVSFRSEYENNVPIEDATRVILGLHNVVRFGRSADTIPVGDGKKTERIQKPTARALQLQQFYAFASESERIFRNLILSKEHQREADMLRVIFNYDKKETEARQRATEAREAADELARNPEATPEQKQQAEDAAAAAQQTAKYCISNNRSRDVQKLKAMFDKAMQCGLLKWYYSENTLRGVVWKWGRGDEDATKKNRRKQA